MARFAPKRKKSLAADRQGSHAAAPSPAHSRKVWPSGMSIFAERTASQWWGKDILLTLILTWATVASSLKSLCPQPMLGGVSKLFLSK